MTVCFVFVGLPCTGKSTYRADYLSDYPVVSSDVYIENYAAKNGMTYSQAFPIMSKEATKLMYESVENLIEKDAPFIWDQTNLTVNKRKDIMRRLPKHYKVYAIVFDPPKEIHDTFIASRPEKIIPDHVMDSMAKSFVKPSMEEGFHDILDVYR